MTQFLLASSATILQATLVEYDRTGTVEAEYGDFCVEGSVVTLAHHGSRSHNPAPCLRDDGDLALDVVGLSHLDLDALGGCLALVGRKPEAPGFWELAAFVDIHGAHKLHVSGASAEHLRALHAWWAWSEANRVYAPRDGSILNVTNAVWTASEALARILSGSITLLNAGDAWKKAADALNADSFVEPVGDVCIRVSSKFVNHMYCGPDGREYKAVVSLNPRTGACTVSFADTPEGEGARGIVQSMWGPEAGGHVGIAGSPRDRRMQLVDVAEAAVRTAHFLGSL